MLTCRHAHSLRATGLARSARAAAPVPRVRAPALAVGPDRGFTLVELAVVIAVMALLLKMAGPVFGTWTRNAMVRATSDNVQTVLRQAQADAASRSRQVVVFRTAATDCDNDIAADASGLVLVIRTIGLIDGDAVQTLRCSAVADASTGVSLSGPEAVCFSSGGRVVGNTDPGVDGAQCDSPKLGELITYAVSAPGADRPLRVTLTPGGTLRACDPNRSLADGQPDGCT